MPKKQATRAGIRAEANLKRFKAVQALMDGATMVDALAHAGYAPSVQQHQQPEVVRPIRELFLETLEKQGITGPAVVERLKAKLYALTCKNIKVEVVVGETEDGIAILNIVDRTITVEDHGSQLEAIRLIIRVLGVEAPKEVKAMITSGDIEERRKEQTTMWSRLGGID